MNLYWLHLGTYSTSPRIQKTVINRIAESWKDCRSSKAEPSQVQNKRSKSLNKVSTNDLDQISKVKTCPDKITEYLDQVEK